MIRSSLLTVASACLASATSFGAVDFVRDIQPILEAACINCHGEDKQEGDVRMDTKAGTFKGSGYDPGVTPGDPDNSSVYWTTILPPDDDLVMPPKKQLTKDQTDLIKAWIENGAPWPENLVLREQPRMDFVANIQPLLSKGGPFTAEERRMLRLWTEQGAVWPEGFKLADEEPSTGPADDLELVKQIREKILANMEVSDESAMEPYESKVPVTQAKYAMVPIPGGEFLMGSPESEANRGDDESPQVKVKVAPFWMGKFEVTWDEYEPFMITDIARRKDGAPETIPADAEPAFVVSKPTTPYTEMSFGMGTQGFPAISMTQHAALKYCQWLSAQTGHFYRLPTEAEWEYACRAGTTTAFSWGDDASDIDQYAWYWDNSEEKYQKVGLKLPNPWGLHDMHGNVMEWVLDSYGEKTYASLTLGVTAKDAYVKPGANLYPRVARGGSWYDDPEYLRSAVRFKSSSSWKIQDPQLPKSIWYHTDAEWLGFRLVRPLEVPSAEEMHAVWNSGRGAEAGG